MSASKKRRGLRRPDAPVVVRMVNCDSASGVRPKHSRRVLRAAAYGIDGTDPADLVLACECFNLDAAQALTGYDVAQVGRTGSSDASYVVALRRTRGRITQRKLIRATPAWLARNVRARGWLRTWVEIDRMKPRRASAGHAHPMRAWAMWALYMARAPRGLLGFDGNKRRRAIVARFPGRKVRQVGLLAIVVPRAWPCTKARSIHVDRADHHITEVVLWPGLGRTKKGK